MFLNYPRRRNYKECKERNPGCKSFVFLLSVLGEVKSAIDI